MPARRQRSQEGAGRHLEARLQCRGDGRVGRRPGRVCGRSSQTAGGGAPEGGVAGRQGLRLADGLGAATPVAGPAGHPPHEAGHRPRDASRVPPAYLVGFGMRASRLARPAGRSARRVIGFGLRMKYAQLPLSASGGGPLAARRGSLASAGERPAWQGGRPAPGSAYSKGRAGRSPFLPRPGTSVVKEPGKGPSPAPSGEESTPSRGSSSTHTLDFIDHPIASSSPQGGAWNGHPGDPGGLPRLARRSPRLTLANPWLYAA